MLKKIIGTAGARVLNALLTFLVLWITARELGKEGVGIISLIVLDISIILLVNDLIGGSALVYFSPRKKTSKLIAISYLWTIAVVIFFFVLGSVLKVFPEVYDNLVPAGYGNHILILGFINCLTMTNLNLIVGKEQIRQFNIISSFQTILLVIILSTGIYFLEHKSVLSYVIALYGALGFSLLSSLWLFRNDFLGISLKDPGSLFNEIIKFGIMGQMANLIHLTNKRLSFYVIKMILNVGTLGVYSAGAQLTEGLRIIGQSISIVQFARISNVDDPDYARTLTIRLLKFSVFLTMIGLAIILILPTSFYVYLLNDDFAGIKPVIYSLSVGVIALSASMILAHYFSGTGRPKYNMISSAIGLLFTLVFVFLLIPVYGIVGAGIAATLAYTSSVIYQMIMFIKLSGAKPSAFLPCINDVVFFRSELLKLFKR